MVGSPGGPLADPATFAAGCPRGQWTPLCSLLQVARGVACLSSIHPASRAFVEPVPAKPLHLSGPGIGEAVPNLC